MLMPFADLPGHYRQHAGDMITALDGLGWRVDAVGFGIRPRRVRRWIRCGVPRGLRRRYGPRGGVLRAALLLPPALGWVLRGGRLLHWTDGVLGVSVLLALVPVAGLRVVHQCWGQPRVAGGRLRRAMLRLLVRRGRLDLVTETPEDGAAAARELGRPIVHLPYRPRWPQASGRGVARRHLGLDPVRLVLLLFGVRRPDKDIAGVVAEWRRMPPGERPVLLVCGAAAALDPGVASGSELDGEPDLILRDAYLGPDAVAAVFAASDAVLLPYPPASQRASGVFWDAVDFGRPVLVPCGEGRNAKLVAELGCGIRYDPSAVGWLAQVCAELVRPGVRRKLERGVDLADRSAPRHGFERNLRSLYPACVAARDRRAEVGAG